MRQAVIIALRIVVIRLVRGWLYTRAGANLYPADKVFGFAWGMAHGALMPMGLPALLMGQEVSIFSEANNGRPLRIKLHRFFTIFPALAHAPLTAGASELR